MSQQRDDRLVLNGALSQVDRFRASPAPEQVQVDGRSVANLLSFAAEYGTLIQFYDLADHPDGDWAVFFQSDPSIALALRAGLDLPHIEAEFERLLSAMRNAKTLEDRLEKLRLAIRVILRLIWVLGQGQRLSLSLEEGLLDLIASSQQDGMKEPARRLMTHLGGHSPEHGLMADLECLVGGWFHELIDFLDRLVAAIMASLTREHAAALAALEASLHDHAHPPQSGLWDAFVLLFGHAQKAINRFPRDLIQFYQKSVLNQTSREGRADQLTLTFTTAKGVAQTILPKGTAFLAGTDAHGESIAYAIDSALTVDATSVAMLRTLTVNMQALVPGAAPVPVQVLTGTVTLSDKVPAIAEPFALFGATAVGTDGVLTTALASLGFAVASPCLLLAGGVRTVNIALGISSDSLADLMPVLEAISSSAGGMDPLTVLAQVLQAGFSLRYSSAGGWINVPSYAVTAPTVTGGPFILSLTLNDDADALEAMPGDVIADHIPTVFASLVQDQVTVASGDTSVAVYPYAVLSGVALSSLTVDVDVQGLADLQVSSSAGPIDTSQPFALFGAVPVQYAALDIRAAELFAKQLNSFSISINWFGLPVTSTGFSGYYKAYVVNADGNTVAPGSLFNNMSFTTGVALVNPGLWTIQTAAASSPQYLFQTTAGVPAPAPDAPVLSQTCLLEAVEACQPGLYYDPAMSSVRLSLDQPNYAFGNVLYAANVMAASVQLTAEASACAQQCGRPHWPALAAQQLEQLITVNSTATDAALDGRIKALVQQLVVDFDGQALNAIHSAIAESGAAPADQATLQSSLSAALDKNKSASWSQRLLSLGQAALAFDTVHGNLQQWLTVHATELRSRASALIDQAQALLTAGTSVLAVQAKAAGQAASVARPVVSAGVRSAQDALNETGEQVAQTCVQRCLSQTDSVGFPNQPWVPMAASLSVSYTAVGELPTPAAGMESSTAITTTTFFHLCPFDDVTAVDWQANTAVPLLAPVPQAGALYMGLSSAASSLTLLFRLAPPASGWPSDTPPLAWELATGDDAWASLTPQNDTTNGFQNTGIVSFKMDDAPDDEPLCLRVSVAAEPTVFPALAGLATNAATASWIGPGGASSLDLPLPPGTIIKGMAALPSIGSVEQPMASTGGQVQARGSSFDLWLAERLRHKDRGIQVWDYASMVLAKFPSLWQLAVVPASNGGLEASPGHVWVIPVPGPHTPDIADSTAPSNDAQMLSQIQQFLLSRISPFIQLAVTNPPYARLTVCAEVLFTDDDAEQACITRLNQELIEYLSPWPPTSLGRRRAHNYYTKQEVTHFVRHRPYVRGVLSLKLTADVEDLSESPYYLTSALAHCLNQKSTVLAANGSTL